MIPAARDLLEKSAVMFAERSRDASGIGQVSSCGIGFFVSPHTAISCQHSFVGLQCGDEVDGRLLRGDIFFRG